ncbi:MAG TPA: nuclear transport factor 2 family protein [Candidatus Methanoperedens sp.]
MKDVVLNFIDAINAGDVEKICSLMAPDHVFIDNIGHEHKGVPLMKSGWSAYFESFPDYKIEISEVFERDKEFVLLGRASASFRGEKVKCWSIPAAWKVIIEKGKVRWLQVFADTKVQFDAMS